MLRYGSSDQEVLKNVKEGATVEMAERFTANCKSLGLVDHGDFIICLPGETRGGFRKTIDFVKLMDKPFVVLGIGVIEWLRCRGTLTHPLWGLIFPALAISAAGMLFMHKHGSGAAADKIYLHHSVMASSGIVAMVAKVVDDTEMVENRLGSYLWPGLIMFIGVMLLFYSE